MTVTEAEVPLVDTALTDAGAPGTSAGVIVGSGDGIDAPTALYETIRKSTGTPFVRPVIVHCSGLADAATVQLWPDVAVTM